MFTICKSNTKTKQAFTLAEVFNHVRVSRKFAFTLTEVFHHVRLSRKFAFTLAEVFNHVRLSRKFAFTLAEVFHHVRLSRKFAFTLVEVLITLGIIGIVAALTISNIVNIYTERQTVVRLKQTYGILNQAFLKMVEENGTLDVWEDDSLTFLKQEFLKHLKITKSCINDYNCYVNSSGMNGGGDQYTSYTLANGTVLNFRYRKINKQNLTDPEAPYCYYEIGKSNINSIYMGKCGGLKIDINGKKGPNKDSKDIFTFILYTNNIIPLGAPMHTTSSYIEDFNRACVTEKSLDTCTAWVIYNENMDYLRCPEKLGWNKAKSCKD